MKLKYINAQLAAATAFTLSMSVLAVLILWYATFERSPLTYKNLPFPVKAMVLKPGDRVPLEVMRCNLSSKITNYVVTRYIQSLDGQTSIILGSNTRDLPVGCGTLVIDMNVLPSNLQPGNYRIVGTGEIQGTVKVLSVQWYSEPFTVRTR